MVFGDSIAFGFYDIKGGWVTRLKTYYASTEPPEKKIHTKIYNLAISGALTTYLFDYLEINIKPRNWVTNKTVIIFEIGINDSAVVNRTNKTKTSLKTFENNIQNLIEISRKYTNNICFIGLTQVEKNKLSPVPWDPEISYNNKSVKIFNKKIEEICQKEKIAFISIFESFNDRSLLTPDGAHLNNKGHKLIFEIVKDFLKKKKFIK